MFLLLQSVDSLAVTREESRSVSKSQSGKSRFASFIVYSIIHAWLFLYDDAGYIRVRVFNNNSLDTHTI